MTNVDPSNPLSAIGTSNDPSLTARTTANAASTSGLRNALAQLTQIRANKTNEMRLKGLNDIATARVGNEGQLNTTALNTFGVHPNNPDALNILGRIATNRDIQAGLETNKLGQEIGRTATEVMDDPSLSLGEISARTPNLRTEPTIPMNLATSAAGATTTSNKNKSQTARLNPETNLYETITTEEGVTDKGGSSGNPNDSAFRQSVGAGRTAPSDGQVLIDRVAAEFSIPSNQITEFSIVGVNPKDPTEVELKVNGETVFVPTAVVPNSLLPGAANAP